MKIMNIMFAALFLILCYGVRINAQSQPTFYGIDAGISNTGLDNSFFGWKAGQK